MECVSAMVMGPVLYFPKICCNSKINDCQFQKVTKVQRLNSK